MNDKIRFGLIGYGKVAGLHAQALRTATHCELVSVSGHHKEKRDAFAGRWGLESRDSVEEMVKQDGVEAVVITTPHPQHFHDAMEALGAGCHVLVEKPLALSVQETEAMIGESQARGRLLGVISQRRWYPSCRRIRRAIDDGVLGVPSLGQLTILGWRDEAYYRSDPWRGSWEHEGGGVIVNQAPHQFDLLCWYMGEVATVYGEWANINHPYIEVEDSAVATVRFRTGGSPRFSYRTLRSRVSTQRSTSMAARAPPPGFRPTAEPCLLPGEAACSSRPTTTYGRFPGRSRCASNGKKRMQPSLRASMLPGISLPNRKRILRTQF